MRTEEIAEVKHSRLCTQDDERLWELREIKRVLFAVFVISCLIALGGI